MSPVWRGLMLVTEFLSAKGVCLIGLDLPKRSANKPQPLVVLNMCDTPHEAKRNRVQGAFAICDQWTANCSIAQRFSQGCINLVLCPPFSRAVILCELQRHLFMLHRQREAG